MLVPDIVLHLILICFLNFVVRDEILLFLLCHMNLCAYRKLNVLLSLFSGEILHVIISAKASFLWLKLLYEDDKTLAHRKL